MLTNPPVPYDPISHVLTFGSTPVLHSVFNVKALVGTYNQEKALVVGAFSGIVKTDCESDGAPLHHQRHAGRVVVRQVPLHQARGLHPQQLRGQAPVRGGRTVSRPLSMLIHSITETFLAKFLQTF